MSRTIEGGDLKSDRRISGQIHFCDVLLPYGMHFDGKLWEQVISSSKLCAGLFVETGTFAGTCDGEYASTRAQRKICIIAAATIVSLN